MKFNNVVMLSVLFAATGCSGLNTDVKKFFSTGANPASTLPADQIYPKGQLFPFSFYSTGGGSEKKRGELLPEAELLADQKEIIDAGVTMIGPQYELNNRIAADAAKYKVKGVYTIIPVIDGKEVTKEYLKEINARKEPLDIEKLRQSVSDIVSKAGGSKEIAWWDITPEELRPWVPQELLLLKTATEAIKQADPEKRPVFMYFPGHYNGKAMGKLAVYLDIIGKGMYTNYSSMKNSRSWCRWTIEQEIEAIKLSGNKNSIPVAVTEMFQQPPAAEVKLIDSWVRYDVYSALIAGAKGVLIFSASKRPDFSARKEYLNAYFKVCRDLNGPLKLGQVFLFGAPMNDITLTITDGPQTVPFKYKTAGADITYPAVSMANIAYNSSRYIFLVNSSDKQIEAVVGGLVYGSGVTIEDLFAGSEKFTAPEGDFSIKLEPLEAKAFRIYNAQP
ncbi:MAG: hypothetical protein WCV67_01735 [Victivallaceae bacterium]|jgi:hypothetical protein